MKKQSKKNDITEALESVKERLVSLENKIDTIIRQTSARTPAPNNVQKPFQRFDRPPQTQFEGDRNNMIRRDARMMYKTVCADCKNECEVPFKPSQDRPVYCRDCFAKRKAAGNFKTRSEGTPKVRPVVPIHAHAVSEEKTDKSGKSIKRKKASPKRHKK